MIPAQGKTSLPYRRVEAIAAGAVEGLSEDKGKAVITPGFMNKMTQWMVGMSPRSMATALAGRMMKGKRAET